MVALIIGVLAVTVGLAIVYSAFVYTVSHPGHK